MKNRLVLFCLAFLLRGGILIAQTPQPVVFFDKNTIEWTTEDSVFNKKIPPQYDTVIRLALRYYPELKYSRIIFRAIKTRTPLAAAPTVLSVFRRPSKRRYIVTISTQSTPFLNKIILDSLSFNAQIGVLGHEISHLAEFNSWRTGQCIGLIFRHLSRKAIDRFEYNTDKRCIEHGLGHQLLAWSENVRKNLNVAAFNRAKSNGMMARERYMHPPTIQKFMAALPIYAK
jgi:hypothetical protein